MIDGPPSGTIVSVFIGRGMLESFSAFFLLRELCYSFHIAAILVFLDNRQRFAGSQESGSNDHFVLSDGIFNIAA